MDEVIFSEQKNDSSNVYRARKPKVTQVDLQAGENEAVIMGR